MVFRMLKLFKKFFLIFPTRFPSNIFILKLRQSKILGIAISLSKIGLQIISWAILSEIVLTYHILLVYTSNYILLYFYR